MSSPRILIVDDEKNIRLTVSMGLEPLGYEISTAVDGEDALRQLQEQEFDLMLLDIQMPGMDGIEVLRQAVMQHPDRCPDYHGFRLRHRRKCCGSDETGCCGFYPETLCSPRDSSCCEASH